MIDLEPNNLLPRNKTPAEFARDYRDILENLAKHGSPLEQAMAKAYIELYGNSK